MDKYNLFEVDVRASAEITRLDNEGSWVPGYAPGNGKYREPETVTYRIVCRREEQAREKALAFYRDPNLKDVEVLAVRLLALHGLVVDLV